MRTSMKSSFTASLMMIGALCLGACEWDQNSAQATAIDAVREHYRENPPPPRWTLYDVTVSGDDTMLVDILVEDENDVRKIQTRSHMTKFFIAKLACPKAMTSARMNLTDGYRIWVRLLSPSQTITQSICPHVSV